MTRHRQNAKAIRYMVRSALAAVLVTGCAQSGHVASTGSASARSAAKSEAALDNAVAKAEQFVAKNPVDMTARAELAHAYLRAGRFEAAVTTFGDAIQLGDNNPRTVLGLALAHVGAGQNGKAVAALDQHRDAIPASDYGLALALAGETSRGVSILTDALRNGEDTPKLRQNLAYAYALDGRWREARLMAAQDVPADQLDARISDWAMAGKPEDYRIRVAGLLGAPVRTDLGQPEYLALNTGTPSVPVAAATVAEPMPAVSQGVELPAVAFGGTPAPVASSNGLPSGDALPDDTTRPATASTAWPADTGSQLAVTDNGAGQGSSSNFETAFGKSEQAAPPRYSYKPVVQTAPASTNKTRYRAAFRTSSKAATMASAGGTTHLVQLGSFSSEAGARQAWNIYVARNPELKGHGMNITQANVNGRTYWRVAAAGFNSHSAAGMCSTVRYRGDGCIAYAANRPLPGALPARGSAPMMARN